MLSRSCSIYCVSHAAVSIGISVAHAVSILREASEMRNAVAPLHFSLDGTPSIFVGWRWFGIYPLIVVMQGCSLVSIVRRSRRDNPEDGDDAKSTRWDAATLVAATTVTIVAQVSAGMILLGQRRSMEPWLPKVLVAAVVIPAFLGKL